MPIERERQPDIGLREGRDSGEAPYRTVGEWRWTDNMVSHVSFGSTGSGMAARTERSYTNGDHSVAAYVFDERRTRIFDGDWSSAVCLTDLFFFKQKTAYEI